MRTITVKELLSAVGGTLLAGSMETKIASVSTDSRTAGEGALFVPLVGERFDGHDYIDKALAAGAAGCLCVRVPAELQEGKFYVQVADTMRALKALASWYRGEFDIPFVQVTGSVGKTTAKEMIACVLSQHFRTLKTDANFNNEIGTPQTLLRLSPEHQAAVIETGMDHAGQIRYLGEMVRPQIAVITNVGDAHIEFFGSRRGILAAKCEIFENLSAGGLAVLNGDDELLNTVTLPQHIIRCGVGENCDVHVKSIIDRGMDGMVCDVITAQHSYHLEIPAPGRHMIYPASFAVAIGEALGLSEAEIVRGVAAYEPAGSRMHVIHLPDGRRLLDDCYNANPQSVEASLRVLSSSEGKKVAVLGDMAELGELTEAAHEKIGKLTKELGIDQVIAIGVKARRLAENAADNTLWFETVPEALAAINTAFTSGCAMLVKASHSMHFEQIVKEFSKEQA